MLIVLGASVLLAVLALALLYYFFNTGAPGG